MKSVTVQIPSVHPQNPGQHELLCPYCGAAVLVADSALLDGKAVRCAQCGSQSMLTREWVGHMAGYHWSLVETGDDDEP